jgi:hypothetical protein
MRGCQDSLGNDLYSPDSNHPQTIEGIEGRSDNYINDDFSLMYLEISFSQSTNTPKNICCNKFNQRLRWNFLKECQDLIPRHRRRISKNIICKVPHLLELPLLSMF